MALIATVNLFIYGVMRNLFYIGMTFPAGDGPVNRVLINSLIDVEIDPFTVFINSAKEPILVAHETIVLVGSLRLGVKR